MVIISCQLGDEKSYRSHLFSGKQKQPLYNPRDTGILPYGNFYHSVRFPKVPYLEDHPIEDLLLKSKGVVVRIKIIHRVLPKHTGFVADSLKLTFRRQAPSNHPNQAPIFQVLMVQKSGEKTQLIWRISHYLQCFYTSQVVIAGFLNHQQYES